MKLGGVIPPIGTPLRENDRVDQPGLRRLARYLLDAGVHAIFANGSMGGFAFLTEEEQLRSIATTVAEVNGAVPVMGGIGETSTSRAVRMAKLVAREAVDYVSILAPFYFLTNQEQMIAFFSDVADASDKPILVYDNPTLTKNPIHPETVVELCRRIPHLAGFKVSNPDFAHLQRVLDLTREFPHISVLTGSEFLIVVAMQMGCDGFVGGLHNICPHIAVALYTAFQEGDLSRARELQQELTSAWELFRVGSIWGGFDEALRCLDICERATGKPYVTRLGEEDRKRVRKIVDAYVRPYLPVRTG